MTVLRQLLRALAVAALAFTTGAILTLPRGHEADEERLADYLPGSPSNPPDR